MNENTLSFDPDELWKHASWVRSLARRLVRDVAAADDLVQETFLAALERRPQADRPMRPWLATVVRRQAKLRTRGELRRREREREVVRDAVVPPEQGVVERADTHRMVLEALLGLAEPHRSVLLQRFFEGLEPREIARRGGLSASTVRSRIERGLDALRAALDQRAGGDRRAWSLALVPLAVRGHEGGAGLHPWLRQVLALPLSIGILTAASVIVLFAWFLPSARDGSSSSASQAAAPAAPGASAMVSAESPASAAAVSRVAAGPQPELPAATAALGRVRGRLSNAESGRPVARYSLRLSGGGASEVVESDAQGRFASEGRFGAGALTVEYLDHPRSIHGTLAGGQVLAFSGIADEILSWELDQDLRLEVHPGPEVAVTWSADVPLVARDLVAELRRPDGVAFGPEPVRDGEPPLVRFGFPVEQTAARGPCVLALSSRDGLWIGSSELILAAAEPVSVDLEPAACLLVRVRGSDGSDLNGVASVQSSADDGGVLASASRGHLDTLSLAARDGNVYGTDLRLTALPLGSSRVEVRAQGYQPWIERVEHPRGRVTEVDVVLTRLDLSLSVAGELRSRSGTFEGTAAVMLRDEATHELRHTQASFIERDGEMVGSFALHDLPPGRYSVRLLSGEGNRRWSGRPGIIEASVQDLVLVYEDLEPVETLVIEARNGRTGEPCLDARIGYELEDLMHGQRGPIARIVEVPLGAELRFVVVAPGFVPHLGDASKFAPAAAGERRARVDLAPGWGALLCALDDATGRPLPGVRVLLDGVAVAVTDEGGLALVAADVEPQRLEVEGPGLELVSSPLDPATGKLGEGELLHEFRLR